MVGFVLELEEIDFVQTHWTPKKHIGWFSGDQTTAPLLLVRALYCCDLRAVSIKHPVWTFLCYRMFIFSDLFNTVISDLTQREPDWFRSDPPENCHLTVKKLPKT